MATRMQLLEIDGAPGAPAAPVKGTALDPSHTSRQEAARLACEEIGIKWPATILAPGTALYTSGVETLKADRARWARLPTAAQAVPVVVAALAAEDRRDFDVRVSELRMDPKSAKLVRAADVGVKPGLGYNQSALGQMLARVPSLSAQRAPRSHTQNVAFLDADLRAAHFNRHVERDTPVLGETAALLRTKLLHDGQRVARAVLSTRYADVNDVDVATSIAASLNGDSKVARLDYRPGDDHSQFELLWPSEIPVKTFVVGDVHRATVTITNSETGKGAVVVRPGVVRAACANLTLSFGVGIEVRMIHIGNAERVVGMLRAAIAQAAAQVEPLIRAITASAGIAIPSGQSPSDIFAKLARKSGASVANVKAWESVYDSRYAQSPTLWGVTSAITDAAQLAASWWEQNAQEEVASELLAKQWVMLS